MRVNAEAIRRVHLSGIFHSLETRLEYEARLQEAVARNRDAIHALIADAAAMSGPAAEQASSPDDPAPSDTETEATMADGQAIIHEGQISALRSDIADLDQQIQALREELRQAEEASAARQPADVPEGAPRIPLPSEVLP